MRENNVSFKNNRFFLEKCLTANGHDLCMINHILMISEYLHNFFPHYIIFHLNLKK